MRTLGPFEGVNAVGVTDGKSVVFGVRTDLDSEPSFVIHGQMSFVTLRVLIINCRQSSAGRVVERLPVVSVGLPVGAHEW